MIDLHFVPTPNGHKVTIMLEEIGVPYRLVRYDMLKGEHLAPAFRAINPNGRLPAIVDHTPSVGAAPFAVFESGAILLYLAEKYRTLLSADTLDRSLALQWLFWQMSGLGPMHGQAHHFIRYAPVGNDYAETRYANEARRLLMVLDRRLGEAEYLARCYSIADVAAWPWVRAARLIRLDLTEFSNIERWFAAIAERPAVIAGVEEANLSLLGGERVSLDAEQWSNLFGVNMLVAGTAT